MPKSFSELGELQRALMELLWSRGPATVRELLDALDRETPPAYTTVLSVVQKLEKSGWVGHEKEGRSHRYFAARSRDIESRRSLKGVVQDVFQGDPMALFQQLLDDEPLADADLQRLQQLIDAKRREQNDA